MLRGPLTTYLFNWRITAIACAVFSFYSPPSPASGAENAPLKDTSKSEEAPSLDNPIGAEIAKQKDDADKLAQRRQEQAKAFDRWLSRQMSADDVSEMERSCHVDQNENPFCYPFLNHEELSEKTRTLGRPASNMLGHKGTIRPRLQRRKVTNWLELRFGSLSPLIRGMYATRPSDTDKLRKLAKEEQRCPNNIAIALAATLEDQIVEGVPLDEIGELYFKGGDCLVNSPSDRESLVTRAGLFFYAKGNVKRAAQIFVRASEIKDAFTSRPLYWLYRSQMQLKREKEAKKTLATLQARYPFSFHTLVALTAMGKDPGTILDRDISPIFTRSQNTPSLNHLLEAQEWANRFGLAAASAKLLEWSLKASQGVEPEVMVYLAELKEGHGDHHGKISILTDVLYNNPALVSRETLEQYFPKVLFPVFDKQSAMIDPYLLIAVARRESAFRVNAVSGAKARGLLQIMPATARKIAGDVNLLDPEVNVEIGAKYLTQLLQKTNGNIHLALAGYNAGPHKVSAWTQRYPVTDPILFIDMIPFRETREYVASVLRNYYWYRRIHRNDLKWDSKRWVKLATSPDEKPVLRENN